MDSLYGIWEDPTQSTRDRMMAYKKYIWDGFLFSEPRKAIVLAQAMHDFGKKRIYPKAIIQAFTLIAIAYDISGDGERALVFTEKAIKGSELINDKYGLSEILIVLGVLYDEQGNYPMALESYKKALAIDEELDNKEGIAMSLNNIANIYNLQDNSDKALEYYKKALAIDEELGIKQGVATELSNVGVIYSEQGNYELALEYYEKSLLLHREIEDKTGEASSLRKISGLYLSLGDTTRALYELKEALVIDQKLPNPWGASQSMTSMGQILLNLGELNSALNYCLEAYDISVQNGLLEHQRVACKCLYATNKKLGNIRQALAYFEEMIEIKDEIYNDENTKKLTRLEMQYEFDKKETENRIEQEKKDALAQKEIERQKLVRNGFIGGFTAVLLFAVVFFVQRNRISKEKERSEELLLNILPEETAKELKEKGHADAQLIEHVTVLFTDFKGFTSLSEKLSPKDLVKDLHECFSAFDRICEKYGIEKIKTIGDAYMAAGGLPTPNKTHAEDVVRAAMEISAFVELGKKKKIENGEPFFEIRVGVHTGPVVAGIVGIKKFQYDIWGDTVNTASRMESSGAVGRVNMSESTYKLVHEKFDCEFRGEIEAKGKGKLKMYFVNA